MGKYYDGTKLLSMKDINNSVPEIYICTTNRTGGKTTYFNRLGVNSVKKGKGKTMWVYRFNYELDDCADKIFKDISQLFFNGSTMKSERKASGIYHELFIDDEPIGYAVSLNSADQLKKYSHLFSDTNRMIFDEFQSETNHYCNDEVKKLISIHTSVARGQGEQVRYVPVYMLGNPVTILNPYYVELGITNRLNSNTNFLRGDGWVLEQGFNESASKAQEQSAFNRAFKSNNYVGYASQGVYLNDSTSFIEKINGKFRYLATLKYNGCEYALKEYPEQGVVYCDNNPDKTYKDKIAITTDDHNINYVMLKRNDLFITNLRYFFDQGCFRFKDLKCKEVILKMLSY